MSHLSDIAMLLAIGAITEDDVKLNAIIATQFTVPTTAATEPPALEMEPEVPLSLSGLPISVYSTQPKSLAGPRGRPHPTSTTSTSSSSSSTGSAYSMGVSPSSASSSSSSSSSYSSRIVVDLTEDPIVKSEPIDTSAPMEADEGDDGEDGGFYAARTSPAYDPTEPSWYNPEHDELNRQEQEQPFDDFDVDDEPVPNPLVTPQLQPAPQQQQPQQPQQQQQPITLNISTVQQLSITQPVSPPLPQLPVAAVAPIAPVPIAPIAPAAVRNPRQRQRAQQRAQRRARPYARRADAAVPDADSDTESVAVPAPEDGVESALFTAPTNVPLRGRPRSAYKRNKAPAPVAPEAVGIKNDYVPKIPDPCERAYAELDGDINRLKSSQLDVLLTYMVLDRKRDIRQWRAEYVRYTKNATPMTMLVAVRQADFALRGVRSHLRVKGITEAAARAIEIKLDLHDKEEALRQMKPIVIPPDAESAAVSLCNVCGELFATEHTARCGPANDHVICKPCLYSYIVTTREANVPLAAVPCYMGATCGAFYPVDVLRSFVPRYYLLKMHRAEVLLVLNELIAEARRDAAQAQAAGRAAPPLKGFLVCKCGGVAAVTHDDVERVDGAECVLRCPRARCNLPYCAKCNRAAHIGRSCEAEVNDTEAAIFWMTQHAKRCPRCNVWIEKNDGCNHMSCLRCNKQFCWVCLGDWPRCACVIERQRREREARERARATTGALAPAPAQAHPSDDEDEDGDDHDDGDE